MTDCSSIRRAIREGKYSASTAGLCQGFIQANVVILPAEFAEPFAEFCYLNPKPCPLLAVGDRGDPLLPEIGPDIDIRTDVAGYHIYREGKFEAERNSIVDDWNEELVSFALGCSHSFEDAMIAEGIGLRHIENRTTVPMFRTNIETVPNEVFGGQLVVSMRPIRNDMVDLAAEISSRFPHSHGGPVHVGKPADLGIANISSPDWGDTLQIGPDETPVFWACGVTSQLAVQTAKPPIAITHRPGSMLITEIRISSEVSIPGLA